MGWYKDEPLLHLKFHLEQRSNRKHTLLAKCNVVLCCFVLNLVVSKVTTGHERVNGLHTVSSAFSTTVALLKTDVANSRLFVSPYLPYGTILKLLKHIFIEVLIQYHVAVYGEPD